MNREIKFRMWSKEYQQMFGQEHLMAMYTACAKLAIKHCPEVSDSEVGMPLTGIMLPFDSDGVFMQYTGMFDKNNNQIYEGDIVKFNSDIGEIVHENGAFGIGFKKAIDYGAIEKQIPTSTGCDNNLLSCCCDNFISLWEIFWNLNMPEEDINSVEIIGNIHENPQLLKREDGNG